MYLSKEEEKILDGEFGYAAKKAMEILVAIGKIYNADKLIEISSAQIAGVSYDNLGDEGIEFLNELAKDGKVKVTSTLNPAGIDIENWKNLGIEEDFAEKQMEIVEIYKKMGIIPTCSCTPYLIGNLPHFGEHIAWSESSAVAFANSVIGARTNREGGPSALAAAIIGKTPNYGLHLEENRIPEFLIEVEEINGTHEFGALGYLIGKEIGNKIPLIKGIKSASIEELKSFSASIATYGGTALFYIDGITHGFKEKKKERREKIVFTKKEIKSALEEMNDEIEEVDFVCLGCPHLSIEEIKKVAEMVKGKKVKVETWLATSRNVKKIADSIGYTKIIESAGIKFACDTCMVVAPLKGRFKSLVTDSAKACYYGRNKNNFKVHVKSFEDCIKCALGIERD